jgi:heat shock protein HtpX
MNIYKEQSKNVWKTWALMTIFLVIVIALGWFFAQAYNSPVLLYIAVIFSIGMNIFSYWFSDKIVLKMYRAQEVTDISHVDLYNIVENLSITAGLPMPKVYVIPDPAPNAFATGRNKDHAAVAVTTGLIERLNKTELEGVIAHELAHIGNRDILISTVIVVLVGFISILSDMFMRSMWFGGHRDDDSKAAGIFALVGIILAILSPIIATIIQLAISRKREYLADASGALLTRYPEGLASALEKISSYPGEMQRATNATAHMFIANPFGRVGHRLGTLFATHPPVQDRIQILRGMKE